MTQEIFTRVILFVSERYRRAVVGNRWAKSYLALYKRQQDILE